MRNKGYIKLHRQLQDCPMWYEDRFSKGQAWVDLLLLANHSDKKILFNGDFIVVKRGQYLTSMVKLAEKWKWDRKTVNKFLKLLEKDKMITLSVDKHKTLITIDNYCIYQSSEDNGMDNGMDINKNDKECIKNDKNEKERKKKTFCPPTVDEVREYLQSVGSSIDPEAFVAFYESKGWMVGKNKMKSWKMAIVTWEKTKGLKRELPKEEAKEAEEEIYKGDDW